MGVQVRIVVYAPNRETAENACRPAFARIADLEAIMSDYRPDSEAMKLCDKAGGEPVPVGRDLFVVLERAQDVAKRSNGAFDVTVGPLVTLWRASRKTLTLPRSAELTAARALVGWRLVKLDKRAQTVQMEKPGMRLDLGGIAKGYALDEAYRVLRAHGIRAALLEAGGDIVMGDAPPGEKGWPVEVVAAGKTEKLHNCAISTSGDTFQYIEIGGERYSHIVDPKTGLGLTDHATATVIARDGMTSDSLTKPCCILDQKCAEALVRHYRGARLYYRKRNPQRSDTFRVKSAVLQNLL